jgi:hypothetical protein
MLFNYNSDCRDTTQPNAQIPGCAIKRTRSRICNALNDQSHANGSATKMVPVLEEADVVRVSPASKFRPSRPSKVVHMDDDPSYSRLLVMPYMVPSFTSDIPGPNSLATAQQTAIRQTPFNPVSCDPGVNENESREMYAFLPDSSTLLSGAESSLIPPTLSSKANGAIETHSDNNLTMTDRVTSRSPLELMAMHQISSGGGYSFLDERQWEGVSTPTSGIPLHY